MSVVLTSSGKIILLLLYKCNITKLSIIPDVTVLLSLTVFLNQVSDSMPNTSDAVPLISKKTKNKYSWFLTLPRYSRHILQLHHDDGGQQRGAHRGGAQLPPQDGGDPRHANLGKIKIKLFPLLYSSWVEFPNVATNLHIIWYFDALTPSWTKFEILVSKCSSKSNTMHTFIRLFMLKVSSWTNKWYCQVKSVFLQWLPWLLRMSRPGKKITRKTITMNSKMNELQLKEKACKSLLANVLDMDDDLRYLS